MEPEYLLRC